MAVFGEIDAIGNWTDMNKKERNSVRLRKAKGSFMDCKEKKKLPPPGNFPYFY